MNEVPLDLYYKGLGRLQGGVKHTHLMQYAINYLKDQNIVLKELEFEKWIYINKFGCSWCNPDRIFKNNYYWDSLLDWRMGLDCKWSRKWIKKVYYGNPNFKCCRRIYPKFQDFLKFAIEEGELIEGYGRPVHIHHSYKKRGEYIKVDLIARDQCNKIWIIEVGFLANLEKRRPICDFLLHIPYDKSIKFYDNYFLRSPQVPEFPIMEVAK